MSKYVMHYQSIECIKMTTLWNRLAACLNNKNALRARENALFDLISSQNDTELASFLKRWPRMRLNTASSQRYRPANPLALAAVSASNDATAHALLSLLLFSKHPPDVDIRWYDANGTKHTILSKLLVLKYYKAAELVLSSGASLDILSTTDVLSASHFNPDTISWLIHHNTPNNNIHINNNNNTRHCQLLFTTDALSHIIQESALQVMYTQFHLQLSSTEKQAKQMMLTHNASVCLRRLIAAGVHPIEDIYQQGFRVVHPSFMERPEFQELALAATTPIQWCKQMNVYFPIEVKEGIRVLLLMNNRWKKESSDGVWLDELLIKLVCEEMSLSNCAVGRRWCGEGLISYTTG